MLVLALICVLCFVIIWKLISNVIVKKNLPPLAAGALPIVGHTFSVLANREKLYDIVLVHILGTSVKEGKETVKIRLGTWDLYVVTNPDDSHLLASCPVKDPIYEFLKPLFGSTGLITSELPTWKKHRKLLNPTFNNKVLDGYLAEFNEQARHLVKCLEHNAGKGLFDQMPYLKRAMLHVVCVTLLGIEPDEKELQNEAERAMQEFTGCVVERIRKFWYHNDFIFNLSTLKKKQIASAEAFHALCTEVLRRKINAREVALQNNDNEYEDETKPRFQALMNLLLDLSEEGALTDKEIREEVNTFIAAGYDTTTNAVAFTLLNIGSYPKVQQKVVEELHGIFEGSERDLEKQDLTMLKYLEAVIKETLRLYPAVVAVGRILEKDLKFKNFTLPTGSRCFTSIYHVGRHPMWGSDAEQFRPERWLDGSLPKNPNAYAVFGLGKRKCIGNNFAIMSMKTILAHVLRHYRVTGDVSKLVQNIDVIVRPVSGHHISIERR